MNLMQEEYFWSIAIEENSVQASIWTIKEDAANVLDVSNPANYENDETLLTAVDSCLSKCIQDLPENIPEPNRTVFGVPSSWVEDGQIVRERLDKIRLLCNKLSLNPTGFVVMPEAIAHFEKSQEKTPMSAVLIGIYPQTLEVSVFRLGNMTGSVQVARSINVTEDVLEGLARFSSTEPFASRFLLYGNHDLEEIKQNLIKADWDILHEKVKFLHTPQAEIFEAEKKMAAVSLAGAAEIANLTRVDFESKKVDTPKQELEGEVVDAAALGFSVGDNMKLPEKPKFKLPNIPKFKKIKFSENLAFMIAVASLGVFIAGFLCWWFLPRATLTIFVSPQKIEGKEKVNFSTNINQVNLATNTIPAKLVSVTVSADKTKTTTGTKTIGTPAKGSVTFYNVGGGTTIPKGTVLDASNLEFTLDSDVNVASASGAASAATTGGNITSKGVGGDYNLASGTYFTVGNFSSSLLQAKNDNDLSGGSSQEVTAVSKDDVNSLVSDLITELTDKAKQNLKTNLPANSLLIDSSAVATPSSKTLDNQIGDEAATVKVGLAAKVSALTVTRSDLDNLAKYIFKNQVKNGFAIKENEIDFIFEPKDVNFIINSLPVLDTNQLAALAAGKNLTDIKSILASRVPGFSDLQITSKPGIPLLNFLPHVGSNISIIISSR